MGIKILDFVNDRFHASCSFGRVRNSFCNSSTSLCRDLFPSIPDEKNEIASFLDDAFDEE